MKTILMAALAAGTVMTATAPADAAQGCGPGGHRGPYGHCLPNRGPGGVIVGQYYRGRGYWAGQRYWGHRERFNGGWRYR